MKILLLNDYGSLAGGAEVILSSLRTGLRQRGHDVCWFSSTAGMAKLKLLSDEQCYGSTAPWRTMLQAFNPAAALRLRHAIRSFRPDVALISLYLTQLSPLILPELKGIPTLHYVQWYRPICPLGTRQLPDGSRCNELQGSACYRHGCIPIQDVGPLALQRRLDDHWAGPSISKVVAISKTVAASLQRHGKPRQYADSVLYPGTAVVEPRVDISARPSVVAAGRMVPEKGFDVLIQAFAKARVLHPKAQLNIIGQGPEWQHLQRLVSDLRLVNHVRFHGQLSHPETLRAIRQAWLVCVPSLWFEPFGMIAVEAQMQGVPVLVSNQGGLAEIVLDSVTGFRVATGDVSALSRRLMELFSDSALVHEMGRAAHRHARLHFGLERFAQATENLLSQLHNSTERC